MALGLPSVCFWSPLAWHQLMQWMSLSQVPCPVTLCPHLPSSSLQGSLKWGGAGRTCALDVVLCNALPVLHKGLEQVDAGLSLQREQRHSLGGGGPMTTGLRPPTFTETHRHAWVGRRQALEELLSPSFSKRRVTRLSRTQWHGHYHSSLPRVLILESLSQRS